MPEKSPPDKLCPECKGTGQDIKRTKAALESFRIDKGSYIVCWNCHGNGFDPAAYFRWGPHKDI